MPSTVAELFAVAGLRAAGAVRWGTPVPEQGSGNYVVALTEDPHATTGALAQAPLDRRHSPTCWTSDLSSDLMGADLGRAAARAS